MRKIFTGVLICIFALGNTGIVYADAKDDEIAQLKMMVKELTKRIEKLEAGQVKVKEEAKMEAAQAARDIAIKSSVSSGGMLPSWAEKVKFKADMRYRNEYQRMGTGAYVYRQRIRARAGVSAKITDEVTAAIGIATGSNGDNTGRSTNQTLQGEFGSYELNLDYGYIDWAPIENVSLRGGKFPNPLYAPSDLLWDGDMRLDGAVIKGKHSLEDIGINAEVFGNAGFYIVDYITSNSAKNPYLAVIQGGIASSFEDKVDTKMVLGYLDFINIQNSKAPGLVPGTGTANVQGAYAHDYNVFEVSGDVTIHCLENNMDVPEQLAKPLKFFYDIAWNATGKTKGIDGDNKRTGWQVGAKLGEKPKSFGEWCMEYNYRFMERNVFPDEFPDADSFRGLTDGYAHEAKASVGLTENWWIDLDFYAMRDKTLGPDPNDKWGYIFQADVNTKF